jgi:hypothetical protein
MPSSNNEETMFVQQRGHAQGIGQQGKQSKNVLCGQQHHGQGEQLAQAT